MAVTITSAPSNTYIPANNDITFVVSSDLNVLKYKLRLKIYVDNTLQDLIYFEKSAMPDGTAYFELSKVISNFMTKDFSGAISQFKTNPNSFVRFYVSIADYETSYGAYVDSDTYYAYNSAFGFIEYLSYSDTNYLLESGNFLSNHLTNNIDTNESAFLHFIVDEFNTTTGSQKVADHTFALGNDDTPWSRGGIWSTGAGAYILSSYHAVPNNPYTLSITTSAAANTWYDISVVVSVLSAGASLTITYGTYTLTITETGTFHLLAKKATINGTFSIDFNAFANDDVVTVDSVSFLQAVIIPYEQSIKTYDSSNTLISEYKILNTEIGANDKYKFLRIPSGTYDLNQASLSVGSQPVITDSVAKYVIVIKTQAGAEYGTATYNIVDNSCKYTPFRLCWLNRLGGYDSFTFKLVSKHNQAIDRKFFKKQISSVNYNSYDREDTQYSTTFKDRYSVTSDWLSEPESTWLSELLTSPDVYWQYSNTKMVAVNIKSNDYQIFKKEADKLFNLQFEFELSTTNRVQAL